MLRPDREFFDGEVESLSIETPRGKEQILAHHLPMILNLTASLCHFCLADGTKKTFAINEGTLTILRDRVVLQSDFLAWEEKFEAALARRERFIAQERKKRKESFLEYKQNKLEMAKTFVRLQGRQHLGEEL